MFDHVTIRVSDREASQRFYSTVLGALGLEQASKDEWEDFAFYEGDPTRGVHIGFCAWSKDDVHAFWQAGVDAGYRSDGEPGPRPEYGEDYYGGFLLDPDGNSVEACMHDNMSRDSYVDHLWIRVADRADTQRFYEGLSEYTGFAQRYEVAGRTHFRGAAASFALVDPGDSPVVHNLHVAFGAQTNAEVDAFHAAAIEMGYRDNGGPGERAQYHPGYYGAFVFDPAGTNVELVNHNRGQ